MPLKMYDARSERRAPSRVGRSRGRREAMSQVNPMEVRSATHAHDSGSPGRITAGGGMIRPSARYSGGYFLPLGTRTRRVAGAAPKAAGRANGGGRHLLVPQWKVRRRRGSGL